MIRPLHRGGVLATFPPAMLLSLVVVMFVASLAALPGVAQPEITQSEIPAAGWIAPLSDGAALSLPTETLDPSVPDPASFLGYALGSRFTHHSEILAYLEALDVASNRVTMWSYGATYEGRPLVLVAITSKQNLARLEEIRRTHLRLADPGQIDSAERNRLLESQPAVVWLSYGVHGNESSSAESAMAAAYLLAADRDMEQALDRLVVLIDPLSNPDGRERYVHGYEQRRGLRANPDPQALEHSEPWPGGRQNHYLIDLNRDWSWGTQQETRHRLAEYRRWEPQVHVDLHEMSSRSSYFFPPAADPIHPLIDPRTIAWLEIFGRGNAEAFDARGWVYYKAENFDLFYPGYGDSYPALRGAVGMTYEMAGGGRAGELIRLPDGRTLSLADRTARHLITSLATVKTAAGHARRLLEDFVDARLSPESEEPTSFLWAADQPEADTLARLLDLHGIRLHRLSRDAEATVSPVGPAGPASGDTAEQASADPSSRPFQAGDWVVSTRQPLGRLARALLEQAAGMPEEFLERQRLRVEQGLDPEFYDITAWTLPLAFNLEAWRMDGEPAPLRALAGAVGEGGLEGRGEVGYLLPPRGLASYRFAARLQREGVRYRLLLAGTRVDGETYPPGTLFVPRLANRDDLEELIEELAASIGVPVHRAGTSWHEEGVSLGSDQVAAVREVQVGLFLGDGLDPTSVGSLWHVLDREIELPVMLLDIDRVGRLDLSSFDTLVLADGGVDWNEKEVEAIKGWLEAGGTLVAIGETVLDLVDLELADFEHWQSEDAEEDEDSDDPQEDSEDDEHHHGHSGGHSHGRGMALEDVPLYTPGAIVATEARMGHPLTVGLPRPPPVLVRGENVLLATGKPQRDLLLAGEETPVITGFAWPQAEERLSGSLLVGLERHGEGRVIVFAQDPAFRVFWRGTMPLLLNAVMYGPSVLSGGRY